MASFLNKINLWLHRNNLHVLKGVFLFVIITLAIHYSYRFWAYRTHYWPFREQITRSENTMSAMVYQQSIWFDRHVLKMEVTEPGFQVIQFSNKGVVIVNNSCSGLKQILQFVILFLVFPGPWIRKLWFIPVGIVIIHLINIFRIVGLSVITVEAPQYWQFSHDYIFRPIFYLGIFLLWIWWVEKLAPVKERQ